MQARCNSNFVRHKQVESCQHHLPSLFQHPFPARNGTGSPPHSQAHGKDDEADVFVDVANEPASICSWNCLTVEWKKWQRLGENSLFRLPLRIGKIHENTQRLTSLNVNSEYVKSLSSNTSLSTRCSWSLTTWFDMMQTLWHRPKNIHLNLPSSTRCLLFLNYQPWESP